MAPRIRPSNCPVDAGGGFIKYIGKDRSSRKGCGTSNIFTLTTLLHRESRRKRGRPVQDLPLSLSDAAGNYFLRHLVLWSLLRMRCFCARTIKRLSFCNHCRFHSEQRACESVGRNPSLHHSEGHKEAMNMGMKVRFESMGVLFYKPFCSYSIIHHHIHDHATYWGPSSSAPPHPTGKLN